MKINTKLRLNTFISVSAVALILVSLVWSWRVIAVKESKMTVAIEMRKTAFERILLRDEFLIFSQAEAAQLWLAKSEMLRKQIITADALFLDGDSKELLRAVRQDFETTYSSFSRIIESRSGQQPQAVFSEAELQLIQQVFWEAASLVERINSLLELTQQKEQNQRNKGIMIVLLVITCGLLAILINSTVIRKTIANRIKALDKGVEAIGSGNLDYRIEVEGNDELSALALVSNEMAAKLKKSYTAIDNLQHEIDLRMQTEKALRRSENRLNFALEASHIGSWSLDLQDHTSHRSLIHDLIFGYETLLPVWTYEMFLEHVLPEDRPEVDGSFCKAVAIQANWDFECRIRRTDGEIRWIWAAGGHEQNPAGKPVVMSGIVQDITVRKQAEERLGAVIADLQRSNKELEQFAYVASHDLQEPLRMVSSYTQLLAERYQDKLDDKANMFIHYAVDGAIRMQLLINDLLAYSRIGTKGEPLEPVDAHAVLGKALNNLKLIIFETHAIITNDTLPEVLADVSQLVQLFQNLIGNALKFRGEASPHIHIAVQDKGQEWLFSVKDNGVGIDPQFADKIFVIFQRLHTKEEYPGSGIGLAICKKIVERHNGKIWFESEPGKGTTFYFTIHK